MTTSREPQKCELVVFDTHPIQYRSPVFRRLSERVPGTEVIYLSEQFNGNRWWFHEVNKIPKQTWGISLHGGFTHRTWNSSSPFAFLQQIRAYLSSRRPKAILVYGYYLPEHWIIWAMAKRRKIPLMFVGENLESSFHPNPIKRALKRFLRDTFLSQVAGFISIGEKNFQYYRSMNIPEERIFKGKYCIDNTFFAKENASQSDARIKFRKQYGISDDSLVLLFVGRLYDRKRPFDLVRLYGLLKTENIHIVVVGNGELEAQLREISKSLPNFHVLGFRTQTELRESYLACDILLVPSEYETWGLVVNEAFVSGMTAAVTSNCGTANDLVIPNETGFVFQVGDMEQLAEWVHKMEKEPFLLAKLKANALRRVQSYNPSEFADQIEAAFHFVTRSLEGKGVSNSSPTRAVR